MSPHDVQRIFKSHNFFVFQVKSGTQTGHVIVSVGVLNYEDKYFLMSLVEEKSTYSTANLVFVAKMSDGKFFNGLLDKSLKNKNKNY